MSEHSLITPSRLLILYDVSQKINSLLNLKKLLHEIMVQAVRILHAEKGFILLKDEQTGELSVEIAEAMNKETVLDAGAMSRTVVEKVEEQGKPVLIQKVPDTDESDRSLSMIQYRLKSIICVPLRSKQQLIGSIYLDTTQTEHFFKEEDVPFLEAFANLAGIAIANAKSFNEIESLNATLERKVEKRTEELKNKNSELTAAFEQLRDAQLRLIQSEKMAALGKLVAGISHEINSPLGSLKSNMDMFARGVEKIKTALYENDDIEPENGKKLYQALKLLQELSVTSEAACERIYQVVRALRNFARLDEEELKAVDIHEGIDSTLILLEHDYRERIQVVKKYGKLPKLFCQAAQINQAFMNILINAFESVEDTGIVRIETRFESNNLIILISDNGIGISEENLRKIFDPGFTTKGVKVGIGLGLPICYKIIEDHNGAITVDSKLGEGTTFKISLPWREN